MPADTETPVEHNHAPDTNLVHLALPRSQMMWVIQLIAIGQLLINDDAAPQLVIYMAQRAIEYHKAMCPACADEVHKALVALRHVRTEFLLTEAVPAGVPQELLKAFREAFGV